MNSKVKTLNIAIAGLGTVGVGTIKILTENAAILSARTGVSFQVTAVSARDRHRDRGVDIAGLGWEDNSIDLAARRDVDMVVELIGGSEGPALALARATLGQGKSFVTANKALIAHHGSELAALAEEKGAELRFEAAVAGGIPIIKALREGLAANQISGLYGILNGTCNYILTRMEEEGLDFATVLDDAQRLGYAEADPTFDVDGIDTAHKTAILASLAFGVQPDMEQLACEGIRNITSVDIQYASELGYRIKLLGVARLVEAPEGEPQANPGVETRVYPAMVPLSSSLAQVGGATNAVVVDGSYVGQTTYIGAGAGAGPTASAVVADIIDVVRGNSGPSLGVPAADLVATKSVGSGTSEGTYYVRLRVTDRPGVMADITTALGKENVSIDSILQHDHAAEGGVYIVLTTHEASEAAVMASISRFTSLDSVLETPTMIRIESF